MNFHAIFQAKTSNIFFFVAIKNGDLDRLLVPTDSKGRKCGVDNDVINKPYLLFFNLEKCIDARVPLFGCKTPQVCVEQCPTSAFIYDEYSCNTSRLPAIRSQLICQMGVDKEQITDCERLKRRINDGDCARWYLPSKSCKYFELLTIPSLRNFFVSFLLLYFCSCYYFCVAFYIYLFSSVEFVICFKYRFICTNRFSFVFICVICNRCSV